MIQKDKVGHFVISLIGTAFLAGCIIAILNISKFAGAGIGASIMLTTGILWEFQGVFSKWDILADAFGCLFGVIFIMLMWQ